ncbi:DUF3253 domain-containing protein [Futiania mangrovi]|uniref:DUF3253 domain-containing protein n=1 Tax=Futiania mangrovi TaxID=2959716 RepID=A0A9J6PF33_9PROT|nr:DUF3253 domain-containing protein [Futiania mangrovii]MCP1335231.1 DUF3253 domain-containing protein [Futiania mangrovii]
MADTPGEDIEAAILRLAGERGAGKSICPSEAARALAGSDEKAWSRLMPAVRAAAVALAKDGRIVILRKGKPADPDAFKGVYRLALPPEA